MNDLQQVLEPIRQKGAQVFGLSIDSRFANAKFRETIGVQFPFLSDANRVAGAAFGVLKDGPAGGVERAAERSVFVIGKDGTIHYARIEALDGKIPVEEVVEAVASL